MRGDDILCRRVMTICAFEYYLLERIYNFTPCSIYSGRYALPLLLLAPDIVYLHIYALKYR